MVLDCCFADAGADSKALRVPTLTPSGSGPVPAPRQEIGSRVFCASGRDEQAYQSMLGGHWHGAFTWAFTRALEQWKTAPSGQFRKGTVSHVELLFRTRMLLEALSFDQHPVLVDRIGNLPVFQHDTDGERATTAEPDAQRLLGQIDPADGFAYFTFSTSGGVLLAEVVATSTADNTHGSGMKGGREYWRIHRDQFRSSDHGDLVVTKVQGGHWSKKPAPPLTIANADFSCPVAKLWADHNGPATYHKESQGVTHGGFVVDVARQSDGRWTGTTVFYRDTQGGLLFATMADGSSRELTKGRYTPSQKCLITELEVLPKVISGQSYTLQDLGKYVDIHKSHWSNYTCYATTDQDGGDQRQKLRLVGASEPRAICSGDTIYIQSIESDISDWYLRPSGNANDLYYEKGTQPETAHQWKIKKFPYDERDNGKAILLGDLVTFQSQEGTNLDRYMGANAGDGYLSVPQLARPWAIKPA